MREAITEETAWISSEGNAQAMNIRFAWPAKIIFLLSVHERYCILDMLFHTKAYSCEQMYISEVPRMMPLIVASCANQAAAVEVNVRDDNAALLKPSVG